MEPLGKDGQVGTMLSWDLLGSCQPPKFEPPPDPQGSWGQSSYTAWDGRNPAGRC